MKRTSRVSETSARAPMACTSEERFIFGQNVDDAGRIRCVFSERSATITQRGKAGMGCGSMLLPARFVTRSEFVGHLLDAQPLGRQENNEVIEHIRAFVE